MPELSVPVRAGYTACMYMASICLLDDGKVFAGGFSPQSWMVFLLKDETFGSLMQSQGVSNGAMNAAAR